MIKEALYLIIHYGLEYHLLHLYLLCTCLPMKSMNIINLWKIKIYSDSKNNEWGINNKADVIITHVYCNCVLCVSQQKGTYYPHRMPLNKKIIDFTRHNYFALHFFVHWYQVVGLWFMVLFVHSYEYG